MKEEVVEMAFVYWRGFAMIGKRKTDLMQGNARPRGDFDNGREKGTPGFVSVLMGMRGEEEDGTAERVTNYRSKVAECLEQGDI